MTRFFQSIRWRVQVWHAVMLLIAVLAFCFTAYKLAWDNQLRRIDKDLEKAERTLFRSLMNAAQTTDIQQDAAGNKTTPRPTSPAEMLEKLQSHKITLPLDAEAVFTGHDPGYLFFVIQDREGRDLLKAANAPPGITPLPSLESDFNEDVRTEGLHRLYYRSSPSGFRLVTGREITPELEDMRRFVLSISGLGLGIWALGLLGGWWLAGRAIRPIESISNTASRIAEGNLRERINQYGTDSELDQLSKVLNGTFEKLHASFEQQKQFTADASHELKTPVTILLSETQRILKRTSRDEAEYRDALLTCNQTAQRMRRLIDSLLILAKQENQSHLPVNDHCQLDAVLQETIDQLRPLAAEKSLKIVCDLSEVRCLGDADSLGILATNLISNAMEYQRAEGTLWIYSQATESGARFSVRDDGPGIAEQDLPHLFDRFYRADKARTGGSGHSGLGLAIAKTIVQNHGGQIHVESQPGSGCTFVVTLPPAAA